MINADYLFNHGRYADFNTVRFLPVNWIAILSFELCIASGHYVPGILPVNAVRTRVVIHNVQYPLFLRSLANSPSGTHSEPPPASCLTSL
ncbi:hypothetical protein [Salmonella enterica]|uniref:hypothetical protein n=1 Tax=Salmonella enterica TaxID=28901 RepID=UPI00398C4770